uniref:Putative secreted protein n=1 Tax=Anopheles marajoara TaxID=58244 RepID=A0A2M4CCQ9_9DIPT
MRCKSSTISSRLLLCCSITSRSLSSIPPLKTLETGTWLRFASSRVYTAQNLFDSIIEPKLTLSSTRFLLPLFATQW